jgi:uncharacterized membrane protein YjgN (DUF898 family)
MPSTGLSPHITAYRLRFSGTGGEYFRVWFVNLLLSVLTAGLYTPWARRRTARYFYDHTLIANSPLEFTAALRRMVVSFILFVLLYLSYKIAEQTGQTTAVAAMLLGAAVLAPYFWASAMRFRLASTRWRGLQLHFSPSWKEVYLASWPIFVMAFLWIGVYLGVDMVTQGDAPAVPQKPGPAGLALSPSWPSVLAIVGLGALLSLLCVIRVEFNYKSLLVLRAGIGKQRGRWKPVYGDFVRIWMATLGVFVVTTVLVVAAIVGATFLLQAQLKSGGKAGFLWMIFFFALLGILALLITTAPARAYREARMFKLIWSNVGLSQIARFKCNLKPWPFVRLRLLNLLLTFLTLGFYRPFARVKEYRMKVESVTLHVKGGLDQLLGELVRQQEALGDALADMVGLDIVG